MGSGGGGGGGGGGESKIDDEVHVASEINLVNSKQT